MKKIEVIISEDAVSRMSTMIIAQRLAQSDSSLTNVIQRILKGIENGDETVTFELRKKGSKK
tara:strand:+ start:584 stop:769 length:186 start_codon:yes stop_codon:yes gene_type:complete